MSAAMQQVYVHMSGGGQSYHHGYFPSEEDAARAYDLEVLKVGAAVLTWGLEGDAARYVLQRLP